MSVRASIAGFAMLVFLGAATLESQESAACLASPGAGPAGRNRASVSGPQLEQRYPRYVIQRQDVLLISSVAGTKSDRCRPARWLYKSPKRRKRSRARHDGP
jgi:hypothetical protein